MHHTLYVPCGPKVVGICALFSTWTMQLQPAIAEYCLWWNKANHTDSNTHYMQHTLYASHTICNTHYMQHTLYATHTTSNTHYMQHTLYATHTVCNTHYMQHTLYATHTICNTHYMHHTLYVPCGPKVVGICRNTTRHPNVRRTRQPSLAPPLTSSSQFFSMPIH